MLFDTDFGRGGTCHAEQSGYDRYVDGEFVERVIEVSYAGDCEFVIENGASLWDTTVWD